MFVSTLLTASALPLRTSRVIRHIPFFHGWVILGWVILVVGMLGIIRIMGLSRTFTVNVLLDRFVIDLGINHSPVALLYSPALKARLVLSAAIALLSVASKRPAVQPG